MLLKHAFPRKRHSCSEGWALGLGMQRLLVQIPAESAMLFP